MAICSDKFLLLLKNNNVQVHAFLIHHLRLCEELSSCLGYRLALLELFYAFSKAYGLKLVNKGDVEVNSKLYNKLTFLNIYIFINKIKIFIDWIKQCKMITYSTIIIVIY